MAKVYGVPAVLHTDHCAKKILPWVEGVIAAGEDYFAKNGEPLFSSHMLDLSEQPIEENLEISRRTLQRMAKMNMTLEIELGITGGEEDGVDHSGADHSKLYTQPEDVLKALDGDTVGRTLPLKLVRGGRLEQVEVLIGERPRGH